jgi:hypothetical protein
VVVSSASVVITFQFWSVGNLQHRPRGCQGELFVVGGVGNFMSAENRESVMRGHVEQGPRGFGASCPGPESGAFAGVCPVSGIPWMLPGTVPHVENQPVSSSVQRRSCPGERR